MLILGPMNHFFMDFDFLLGVIVLFEDPLAAKFQFQPPSKGNQIW
jgi:hypothetical protein